MSVSASESNEPEVIVRWTGHRVPVEGLYQRYADREAAETSKPRRNASRQAFMRLRTTFPPGPMTRRRCYYRFVAPR